MPHKDPFQGLFYSALPPFSRQEIKRSSSPPALPEERTIKSVPSSPHQKRLVRQPEERAYFHSRCVRSAAAVFTAKRRQGISLSLSPSLTWLHRFVTLFLGVSLRYPFLSPPTFALYERIRRGIERKSRKEDSGGGGQRKKSEKRKMCCARIFFLENRVSPFGRKRMLSFSKAFLFRFFIFSVRRQPFVLCQKRKKKQISPFWGGKRGGK